LYERTLADHGLRISGRSPDGKFVEIAELPGHAWYLAVQFHPEFKSKPTRPHPLFASFVAAAYQHKTAHAQRTTTEPVASATGGSPPRGLAARNHVPTDGPDRPVARRQPQSAIGNRPFQIDNRRWKIDNNEPVIPVTLGEISFGAGRPFVLIAGPCVIESE